MPNLLPDICRHIQLCMYIHDHLHSVTPPPTSIVIRPYINNIPYTDATLIAQRHSINKYVFIQNHYSRLAIPHLINYTSANPQPEQQHPDKTITHMSSTPQRNRTHSVKTPASERKRLDGLWEDNQWKCKVPILYPSLTKPSTLFLFSFPSPISLAHTNRSKHNPRQL